VWGGRLGGGGSNPPGGVVIVNLFVAASPVSPCVEIIRRAMRTDTDIDILCIKIYDWIDTSSYERPSSFS